MKRRTWLLHVYDELTSGYWFVPALMVSAAVLLAPAAVWLDQRVDTGGWAWLYSGGAEGARLLLSTLASSAITVAGVVFSMTIVALTQASSQFGPRILRMFMRDTGNQVVLGTFLATFVYCLLVLRTVGAGGQTRGEAFVPHLAVSLSVLLALASIAVLVYFVHHVSQMLQAPMLVAALGRELNEALRRTDPEAVGQGNPGRATASETLEGCEPVAQQPAAISAPRSGYLQAVEYDRLLALASKHDLVLRNACRPGDYVLEDGPLLEAWPAQSCGAAIAREASAAFLLGNDRTSEQNVEHSFNQMVEIAIRAVSPAINDPFTTLTCIDWLGSALVRVAREGLPGPVRRDASGRVRLITPVPTFAVIAAAAFDQIRHYGHTSVRIVVRMLEVIGSIAPQLPLDEQREVMRRHAELIREQGVAAARLQHDREIIESSFRGAVDALSRGIASR